MKNIKKLSKQDIFNAVDSVCEVVEVPEWGGSVTVQTMTGAARDSFEQECRQRTDGKKIQLIGMRALLVVLTTLGEDGKPMFTREDIPQLNEKNAKALDRIFQVASQLNGLGVKAMEEIRGN